MKEFRVRVREEDELYWLFWSVGLGDREHPKSRPWTHAGLVTVDLAFPFISYILVILYWYTRTTSQGLSRRGQILSFASKMLLSLEIVLEAFEEKSSWISLSSLGSISSFTATVVSALLQFATLLRLELGQDWKVSRRLASKKERDAQRLDSRIGLLIPTSLCAVYFAFVTYNVSRNFKVLAAKGCHTDLSTSTSSFTYLHKLTVLLRRASYASKYSGLIIQMIFNAKAKTYAGSFKTMAIFDAGNLALYIAVTRLEILAGWQPSRAPVFLIAVIALLVLSSNAFQAVLYPGVSQEVPASDEDDEEFM